jgi:hypothetical protein
MPIHKVRTQLHPDRPRLLFPLAFFSRALLDSIVTLDPRCQLCLDVATRRVLTQIPPAARSFDCGFVNW